MDKTCVVSIIVLPGISFNTLSRYKVRTVFIIKKYYKKVQVGKDQEKAQSEKDSHSKNRGGKKPN